MSRGHYPTQEPDHVPAAAVQEIVSNLRQLHDLGKPVDDQAVEDRIGQFFDLCQRSCLRPGVETLCTALSISRTTLFHWMRGIGCSRRRQEVILSARSFIDSCLEQMALTGHLSPPTAIFLMKNWCGYRDSFSIENEPPVKQELEPQLSPEQIMKQISDDIPVDEEFLRRIEAIPEDAPTRYIDDD